LGLKVINKNMIKFDFDKKIVLVTAASKGIGFAIANSFYASGARVAICSRDKKTLNKAVSQINQSQGGDIVGFEFDLANINKCSDLVKKVEDYYGSNIQILINNSGGPPPKKINETDLDDWNNAINQNLMSSILTTNAVIPSMVKNNFGRIIFLTSTVSKEPSENMVLSNVTRAAVATFAKTLSREIPLKSGITVNTILTGGVKTERFYSLFEKMIKGTSETVDEAIDRLSLTVPVGYFSSPDEFSKTILFLASNEASYINGVSLPIDGGTLKSVF
jgi:3-oxoacyl-[acyl-carrier protein] reductase